MKRSFTVLGHRFFSHQPLVVGTPVVLAEEEARHLVTVLRAQNGDEVTLFDGSGSEFTAQVTAQKRQRVELAVLAKHEIDRELPFDLHLAVSLPRGDRQRWLVEKAVELGVSCLHPLITARGVAQPSDETPARLQRAIVEASKQCGRNRLMRIESPLTLESLGQSMTPETCRWLAHPDPRQDRSQERVVPQPGGRAVIAVGPEGGFTDDEVAPLQALGWSMIDLGTRILRIETAALAAVVELCAALRST